VLPISILCRSFVVVVHLIYVLDVTLAIAASSACASSLFSPLSPPFSLPTSHFSLLNVACEIRQAHRNGRQGHDVLLTRRRTTDIGHWTTDKRRLLTEEAANNLCTRRRHRHRCWWWWCQYRTPNTEHRTLNAECWMSSPGSLVPGLGIHTME